MNKEEVSHILYNKFIFHPDNIPDPIRIDENGKVIVYGNILYKYDSTRLPLDFKKVSGNFLIKGSLETLAGSPEEVGGYFSCSQTKISSLSNGPSKVDGHYFCYECINLTSLNGSPNTVGGDFYCFDSPITNLIGSPKYVGGSFNVSSTDIDSLVHGPQFFKNIFYGFTPFEKKLFNDEKTQIDTVKLYPSIIIDKLTSNNIVLHRGAQLLLVQRVPYAIEFILNPSRMVQLTAVKADLMSIRYIKNPDPLVTLYVKQNKS